MEAYASGDIEPQAWLDALDKDKPPPNRMWDHQTGEKIEQLVKSRGWRRVGIVSKGHKYKHIDAQKYSKPSTRYIYRKDGIPFEIHFVAKRYHLPMIWTGCKKIK